MTPDEKYRPSFRAIHELIWLEAQQQHQSTSPCLLHPKHCAARKGLAIGRFGNPSPRFQSPPLATRGKRKQKKREKKKNSKRTLGIHITFNVPAAVEKVALLFPFDLHMLENPPSCSPICSSITSPVSFSLRRSLTFAACPC